MQDFGFQPITKKILLNFHQISCVAVQVKFECGQEVIFKIKLIKYAENLKFCTYGMRKIFNFHQIWCEAGKY